MASRTNGDSTDRTGVFGLRRGAGRRAAGFRDCDLRDVFRREGEVLVVNYTSMITGRITGLRWVTS
jgi:hypothetical protein